MSVQLQKAGPNDCRKIHQMQIRAFARLLETYHDDASNPGAEPLDRVVQRMAQPAIDYYLIMADHETIGAIRIVRLGSTACRLALMFILPEFQGHGYAQQAITAVESLYPHADRWELDTIQQEGKLCYLYEKMGYRQRGQAEDIQPGMTRVFYAKTR